MADKYEVIVDGMESGGGRGGLTCMKTYEMQRELGMMMEEVGLSKTLEGD